PPGGRCPAGGGSTPPRDARRVESAAEPAGLTAGARRPVHHIRLRRSRRRLMAEDVTLSIYRGTRESGAMVDYTVPRQPGMVVLDAIHSVQALHAPDLACRWNCKAGRCGSCGGEVNGKPRLMCMDRVDKYAVGQTITIRPMKTFPVIKDLVTDVSWNFEVNKKIPAFKPRKETDWKFSQDEANRVQEF